MGNQNRRGKKEISNGQSEDTKWAINVEFKQIHLFVAIYINIVKENISSSY
jgi:hypothetical protein